MTPTAAEPTVTLGHPPGEREARWVLKRCARRGHVLAYLDDPIADRFTALGALGPLLRCLRCGDFVSPAQAQPRPPHLVGTADAPATLADVPHALRGGHGRKLAILRLLAVERALRGLVLLGVAAGVARLAGSQVAVAESLGRLVRAAEPLGRQLGWDVQTSPTVHRLLNLLGHSSSTYHTLAWLLAAYGTLEIVEGAGLWGGWRWAEYLAAVATAAFIPLELHELSSKVTVIKVAALVLNFAAVIYLVIKGRLFGVRGGHPAYLDDVRQSTLLAEELLLQHRGPEALTSEQTV